MKSLCTNSTVGGSIPRSVWTPSASSSMCSWSTHQFPQRDQRLVLIHFKFVFLLSLFLKGPSNSAGQAVFRLHPRHHTNHTGSPHQQLRDHQTACAARCFHTSAACCTLQLRGMRVQFRRGWPAPLALSPQHLQGPGQPLSHRPVQRGSFSHSFSAQLGAEGAQHSGERVQVRV